MVTELSNFSFDLGGVNRQALLEELNIQPIARIATDIPLETPGNSGADPASPGAAVRSTN